MLAAAYLCRLPAGRYVHNVTLVHKPADSSWPPARAHACMPAGGYRAALTASNRYTCRTRAVPDDAATTPSVEDDVLSVALDFDDMAQRRKAGDISWDCDWTPVSRALS